MFPEEEKGIFFFFVQILEKKKLHVLINDYGTTFFGFKNVSSSMI